MAKRKAKAKKKSKRKSPKAGVKKKAKVKKRKVAKAKPAKKKRTTLAKEAKAALAKNPKSRKKNAVRLTPKQELFVDCFLGAAKRTATKAAIMAGYSEKTAGTQGSQLLANPYVAAYLKKRQGDLARRLEVTQENVAAAMATMAFAKPTDFLRWRNGKLVITDSDEIPDDMVGAIKSLKPVFDKHGHSVGLEVKFHDRIAAGKVLGQYLNLFNDNARDDNRGKIVEGMDMLHKQAEALGDKE